MRITLLTIIILFCSVNCWAVLPAPPKLNDIDIKTNQYFQQLYDNHNVLTVIKTTPNGARNGASGEIIAVSSNGIIKLWINQGGKVWVQM